MEKMPYRTELDGQDVRFQPRVNPASVTKTVSSDWRDSLPMLLGPRSPCGRCARRMRRRSSHC